MSASLLRSEHLRLRPCRREDLEALRRLWMRPEVRRYLFDDEKISEEGAKDLVRASLASQRDLGFGIWLLGLPEQNDLLGFCGLKASLQGSPELVYGIDPAHWGRGLAAEAARTVLEHAFRSLGVQRVVASVDEPNEASVRVLERIGMRRTGRRLLDGRPTLDYAMAREELVRPGADTRAC